MGKFLSAISDWEDASKSDLEFMNPIEVSFVQVASEIDRAREKFGDGATNTDGTGEQFVNRQAYWKGINDRAAFKGLTKSWAPILLEEVYEALSETDPAKIRAELIQVAATALQWVHHIDTRAKNVGG